MSKAFGEQTPTLGEDAVSWQTWSDGAGAIPNVTINPDWGKLSLQMAGAEGRSAVYDLGSAATRKFTLTENRYGTGSGVGLLQIRGDTVAFIQDDDIVDWETYTAPVSHAWRYVQVRETTFVYYYVDATLGDDAHPGTRAEPWQTIAKVNGETFLPGDHVLFKRGETWREQLNIPSSGSAGLPITFSAYGSGDLPRIYGSTQISTWSDEGSNIWWADCATDPGNLWFVNTNGVIVWGTKEALKASLDTEYEWWFDDPNNRVYVYAASDPDSRYTSIEKPTRNYCVYCSNKDYITVSYLDCQFSGITDEDGYGAIWVHGSDYPIIEYCKVHHTGYIVSNSGSGIYTLNDNGLIVRYNTCYFCGRRGIVVAMYNAGYTSDNILIEHNTVYNNYHAGIDLFRSNVAGSFDGAIVRYNHVYNDSDFGQGGVLTASHGILLEGPTAASSYRLTNAKVYYNLVHHMYQDQGIIVAYKVDGVEIYNNTVYGIFTGSTGGQGISIGGTGLLVSNIIIKNNIVVDQFSPLYVPESSDVIACDNNCWYRSAGGTAVYTRVNGTAYHFNDQAAYQAATGWDTNGKWEDPVFVDAGALDFHLQTTSPCKNTGVDVGLSLDYDGITVPQGAAPDMGAYEYH